MKTFILEWNPEISSYRMEDFKQDMHYIEYGEFNWSVWDWKRARSGDNFYMVKCNGEKTGIVMKGFFTSEPYEAEDWSGRNREVHYMDMRPTVMVHPDIDPLLTTEQLDTRMPYFQWKGGHSGRELPQEYARQLDELWEQCISLIDTDKPDSPVSVNMIPEASIDDAISIASEAHYDKQDGNGRPVILDVLEKGLAAKTEFEMICGFLSRVLAESDISAGTLRERGFSEKTVDVLMESMPETESSREPSQKLPPVTLP